MDVRQLELFLAVLDSPTLTRAAEKMHVSAPAVSLQLQSLAADLRVQLFVRSGRKLVPTPAAWRLAEHARKIIVNFQHMREEFGNDVVKDSRPFHFATGATTLIYRLSGPLRTLRKEFPHINLHVNVLSTEGIIAGLLDHQFDLGLISLPITENNLRIVPLFEEELLILRHSPTSIRRNHVATVTPQELQDAPFVLYPTESNMRKLIDRFLSELGVQPRVIMEASDTEAIKGLVESGFGYSILPEYALKGPNKFFQTLRVRGHSLLRQQALATAMTIQPRALTESVCAFLKRTLEGKRATQSTKKN